MSLSSVVNRLALQIAPPMGLVASIGTLLVPEAPAWTAAAVGLGTAGTAYAAGHVSLHRRLRRLRSILHQIRNQAFDDLPVPSGTGRDELDTLLREASRTAQSLHTEIRELEEREHVRREIIGNVSHELKTPIFSVQGFTETLLDGALEDDDVNDTFLQKILHNVNRLENLARDLSTITKIETDELSVASEEFDVTDLFETTLESVEVKAEEKGVPLHQDVAPNLPTVHGDPDRLRRVLVNLVDNAIKYNREGGTVQLEAEARADEVEIRVVDEGIGIPSDHLPRLAERFYRVDESRSRNQGAPGLGLAIVKHILGAHDRELHVESMPGQGSTFSFTRPTGPHPPCSRRKESPRDISILTTPTLMSSTQTVHTFPDLETLSRTAARDLTADIRAALRTQDRYTLTLAGGSTPRRLYELLSRRPSGRRTLPWSQIHLFWGDERFVPYDHPQSNARMVSETLLQSVPIPDGNVHPIPTQTDRPETAANVYTDTLRQYFTDRSATFDTALLGLGADGHTASLFPETGDPQQRRTDDAWVRVVTAPPRHDVSTRLTCTLPVLNGARRAVFLVAGERKRNALRSVLDDTDPHLPAAQVRPRKDLVWYVDTAARPSSSA